MSKGSARPLKATAPADEATALAVDGPTPEDEETVKGRKKEFAQNQAVWEIFDSVRPVIPLTIRVEVEVEDPIIDFDTLKTLVLMLELAGGDNVLH
ncbi:hypothetical protein QYF36_016000 [Acer negundo]|nr:hypothetical protein QYF36_016000 [Acer negundo]